MRSAALATLLCAGLALGLAGCQRETNTTTSPNTPPVVTPSPNSSSSPTTPPSTPPSTTSPASPGTSSSMSTTEPPKTSK